MRNAARVLSSAILAAAAMTIAIFINDNRVGFTGTFLIIFLSIVVVNFARLRASRSER